MDRSSNTNKEAHSISEQEEDTIQQLKQGLDELDQAFSVSTPSLEWFEHNLREQKKIMKARFLRDFSFFLFSAVVIMIVTIAIYRAIPLLFFVVQALGLLILIPIIALQKKQKQVDHS